MRRYVAGSRSASAGSGLAPSVLALLTSEVGAAQLRGARRRGRAGAPGRPRHRRSPGCGPPGSVGGRPRASARSCRASRTRDQPRPASSWASARPRPWEAPVITATGDVWEVMLPSMKLQVLLKSRGEDRSFHGPRRRTQSFPKARQDPVDRCHRCSSPSALSTAELRPRSDERAIDELLPSSGLAAPRPGIPHDTWVVRHRWVVRILALQCVGLVIFALARGYSLTHSLVEALLPSVLAALAASRHLGKTTRAALAGAGLMTVSTTPGAPLGRLHRGALPLLRDAADRGAVRELDPVRGGRLRRPPPPRGPGLAGPGLRLQPPRRRGPPLGLGGRPRAGDLRGLPRRGRQLAGPGTAPPGPGRS